MDMLVKPTTVRVRKCKSGKEYRFRYTHNSSEGYDLTQKELYALGYIDFVYAGAITENDKSTLRIKHRRLLEIH